MYKTQENNILREVLICRSLKGLSVSPHHNTFNTKKMTILIHSQWLLVFLCFVQLLLVLIGQWIALRRLRVARVINLVLDCSIDQVIKLPEILA